MTRDDLTAWAVANGWRMIAGSPSLTKPKSPKDAIVRLVFKATVVAVEIKKPAGKWEKVGSAAYAAITPDEDGGLPQGLGLEKLPGLSMLMRDNKDQQMMARIGPNSGPSPSGGAA